jgi:transglutaminase-like putative cysteine protease
MLFEVTHVTTYSYSQPVFLEPHTLRFHPRSDGQQRVNQFKLSVEPQPDAMTECLDCEGNVVTEVWFGNLTKAFEVTVDFNVETLRRDPFDYLLPPTAEKLPIQYPVETIPSLVPYLERVSTDDSVAKFARFVTQEARGDTLPFLFALTQQIHEVCRTVTRDEGDPFSPTVTLANREGSCRDLTVLFMEACRIQGIASRFVSGYQEGVSGLSERELHAWAEVYVPGGGWRAYDPTLGLAVSDRHIAVAASRISQGAAPITGSFRGTDIKTQMNSHINLNAVTSPL